MWSRKMFPFMSLCFFYCRAGYKIIKKIGEGTFSEVVKTQSLKDGKFYACKTMKQTINRYVICNQILSCARAISGAFLLYLCCVWILETSVSSLTPPLP